MRDIHISTKPLETKKKRREGNKEGGDEGRGKGRRLLDTNVIQAVVGEEGTSPADDGLHVRRVGVGVQEAVPIIHPVS